MSSKENPRSRPLRPGRKVAAGGIVVALIALGIWLASFLPGLGLGLGGGSGFGTGNSSESKSPASQQKTKTEPKPVQSSDVVTVKVEADRYLLQESIGGKPAYRPVTLGEIVSLAKKAPGDKSGMKVQIRIGRVPAKPVALLMKELLAAGIDRNEIVQREGWK